MLIVGEQKFTTYTGCAGIIGSASGTALVGQAGAAAKFKFAFGSTPSEYSHSNKV